MSYLQRRIENKYGRPLEDILVELLNKKGLLGTAKELGVSRSTVEHWMIRLGIRYTRVYHRKNEKVVLVPTHQREGE